MLKKLALAALAMVLLGPATILMAIAETVQVWFRFYVRAFSLTLVL